MPKNVCWCYHCLTASGRQKKFDKLQGKDKPKYRMTLDEMNAVATINRISLNLAWMERRRIEWTCSTCQYYDNGKCEVLGGDAHYYGFCDGYANKEKEV